MGVWLLSMLDLIYISGIIQERMIIIQLEIGQIVALCWSKLSVSFLIRTRYLGVWKFLLWWEGKALGGYCVCGGAQIVALLGSVNKVSALTIHAFHPWLSGQCSRVQWYPTNMPTGPDQTGSGPVHVSVEPRHWSCPSCHVLFPPPMWGSRYPVWGGWSVGAQLPAQLQYIHGVCLCQQYDVDG